MQNELRATQMPQEINQFAFAVMLQMRDDCRVRCGIRVTHAYMDGSTSIYSDAKDGG